ERDVLARSGRPAGGEGGEVDPGRSAEEEVGDDLRGRWGELEPRSLVACGDDDVVECRKPADRGPGVDTPGPQAGPGPLDLGLGEIGAEHERLVDQIADRARRRPRIEADVLLAGPDEDAAVVARDEVILAVLDDPPEQGSVAAEEDDLSLERR